MQIKNRDDFKKIKIDALQKKEAESKKIRLLVGLGTCGAAAGAGKTWTRLEEILKTEKITNVEMIKVGCVGYCYAEPTVEVVYPDGLSVLLGNIKEDVVAEVIELHIKKKTDKSKYCIKTNIATNIFGNGGKK